MREQWDGSAHTSRAWPEQPSSWWNRTFDKLKIFGKPRIDQLAIGIQPEMSSGRISTILPNWSDAPMILVSSLVKLPHWIDATSKEKGALISNQGFFSQNSLAVAI